MQSPTFWKRITLHAVWLHGGWEVAQCLLFYDMSGTSSLSAWLFMAGATGADVVLTLLLIVFTLRPAAFQNFAVRGRSLGMLAWCGAVTAIFIELLARKFDWWHYSPAMPTVQFFGQRVGLLPIVQMAALPSLAFLLGRLPPSPKRN